jgi:hypothetical protein
MVAVEILGGINMETAQLANLIREIEIKREQLNQTSISDSITILKVSQELDELILDFTNLKLDLKKLKIKVS